MAFIAQVVGDYDEVSDREEGREFFEDRVHRVNGESHASESGSQRAEHRDETDDNRQVGIYRERKSETEHVAIMKRIQMIIGIKTFELRLKSMKLNISILANMAMMENIMT